MSEDVVSGSESVAAVPAPRSRGRGPQEAQTRLAVAAEAALLHRKKSAEALGRIADLMERDVAVKERTVVAIEGINRSLQAMTISGQGTSAGVRVPSMRPQVEIRRRPSATPVGPGTEVSAGQPKPRKRVRRETEVPDEDAEERMETAVEDEV
jgi:hypothetical protein